MPSQIQRMCSFPNFTQQAYRYGIALSCIGVLLNWLAVAQAYIEPVRYLGVGLVIIGSFLIIAAMCRWMFLSPHTAATTTTVHEVSSDGAGDLHVITVPMGRGQVQSRTPGTSSGLQNKPPDYFLVTEKPPSYEEAMSMLPPYPATHSGSLQLNAEGGLEDFIAPHQVPESLPEGAIGGLLQQPDTRTQQTDGWKESERLLNMSSPPAYSQCASLSTHGSSNNNATITPEEGNTDNRAGETTTHLDSRTFETTSHTDSRTASTTSTDNRTHPVTLILEAECVATNTEETGSKSPKITSSVERCQKVNHSESLPDNAFSLANADK